MDLDMNLGLDMGIGKSDREYRSLFSVGREKQLQGRDEKKWRAPGHGPAIALALFALYALSFVMFRYLRAFFSAAAKNNIQWRGRRGKHKVVHRSRQRKGR
jgi:hypothetical protein